MPEMKITAAIKEKDLASLKNDRGKLELMRSSGEYKRAILEDIEDRRYWNRELAAAATGPGDAIPPALEEYMEAVLGHRRPIYRALHERGDMPSYISESLRRLESGIAYLEGLKPPIELPRPEKSEVQELRKIRRGPLE